MWPRSTAALYRKLGSILFISCCSLLLCHPAHASLILEGSTSLSGTGLGNVTSVLTIQGQGNATTESGCVGFDGTGDTFTGCGFPDSNVKHGASQTQTVTPSQIGVSNVDDLRIVFNANQPSGGPITLTNLVMTFYDSSGTAIFATSGVKDMSGNPVSITFTSTAGGVGDSGFVFALDAPQSALAAAVFNSTARIGLGASASLAAGGPETFFATNASAVGFVPEPSTVWLLALGLAACLLYSRLARNRQIRNDFRQS